MKAKLQMAQAKFCNFSAQSLDMIFEEAKCVGTLGFGSFACLIFAKGKNVVKIVTNS